MSNCRRVIQKLGKFHICSLNQRGYATIVPSELLKQELHCEDRVARLVLNNAKGRNVLSYDMMNELHRQLQNLDKNEAMRVVILAAEGPAFSAGHDLKELTERPGVDYHKKVFKKCTELMQLIQNMKLPVIAEVNGVAAAAGCQLVASCDIVVASEQSTFSVPGLRAGIFCSTPGIPLARNVPRKLAMDMLLTARSITASEALRAGLVSRVVPNGQEKDESLRVAEPILNMSRSVTALGKAFFYSQIEQVNMNGVYRQGEAVMCENLKMADAQKGIKSFIAKEKQTPKWTHTDEKVL
ncbi:enoyl-CoA hydratase/isomerase domain-containing protein [Ditylenchus destructor]|nr:enoyl-CoA hydratase/isomerase domain-containing protein [Ditylenchus destructor]